MNKPLPSSGKFAALVSSALLKPPTNPTGARLQGGRRTMFRGRRQALNDLQVPGSSGHGLKTNTENCGIPFLHFSAPKNRQPAISVVFLLSESKIYPLVN